MRSSTRFLGFVSFSILLTTAVAQLVPAPRSDLGHAQLVADTAVSSAQGDVIALYMSGRAATVAVDNATSSWTGDLISLATGEPVGTLLHQITCHDVTSLPCMVFQSKDTFTLPGGTITAEGTESIAPYLDAEPGIFHVGINPQGKSIVSGTGEFAGRTGRAQLKAIHDGREYPAYVTFDDVWIIRLDPKT